MDLTSPAVRGALGDLAAPLPLEPSLGGPLCDAVPSALPSAPLALADVDNADSMHVASNILDEELAEAFLGELSQDKAEDAGANRGGEVEDDDLSMALDALFDEDAMDGAAGAQMIIEYGDDDLSRAPEQDRVRIQARDAGTEHMPIIYYSHC